MATEKPWSKDFDPRQALADVDGASSAMVSSTDAPRGFMFSFVALFATVITLINVVSWSVIIGLSALSIPLGLWYYLVMRNRPKPRAVLSHSGPYMGYFLLFMMALQFSRFWTTGSWGEAGAKWLVVFGVCWFCISRLRIAAMRNRLKDANERHI